VGAQVAVRRSVACRNIKQQRHSRQVRERRSMRSNNGWKRRPKHKAKRNYHSRKLETARRSRRKMPLYRHMLQQLKPPMQESAHNHVDLLLIHATTQTLLIVLHPVQHQQWWMISPQLKLARMAQSISHVPQASHPPLRLLLIMLFLMPSDSRKERSHENGRVVTQTMKSLRTRMKRKMRSRQMEARILTLRQLKRQWP